MRKFMIGLISIGLIFSNSLLAKAESQAACAIWLCLPGGFPTGCAPAYHEFKQRIKKGKPPLPNLSSCTAGSGGKHSNGSYQIGIEYFLSCRQGFQYNTIPQSYSNEVMCVSIYPECNSRRRYYSTWPQLDCLSYRAERRQKTRFIKMWVDGEYLGQFFYE